MRVCWLNSLDEQELGHTHTHTPIPQKMWTCTPAQVHIFWGMGRRGVLGMGEEGWG